MKSSKSSKISIKTSGKAFSKSPISKAKISDVKDIKIRGDYGKRQSQNIVDLSGSHESKKYKQANAIGRMDNKLINEGSDIFLRRSVGKYSFPKSTRDTNILINKMRVKYPTNVGSRVKNVKLDSKPTGFRKKK